MPAKTFRRACLGLAISGALFAQGTGSKGPGVTAPPVPSVGRNPTSTQPSIYPPNSNTMPDIQRPIYVSGKVVLNDGTPPPEPVTMQLVCTGSPRAVGYTDSKGRFSIDLGNRNNTGVFMDASESGSGRFGGNTGQPARNLGGAPNSNSGLERSMGACDLQAYLPGFRSDRVSLANRRALDPPEVGTVVLHRLANVEGLTISATSAMAPKDAKKAFEKGMADAKKAKWENAQREFEKAVDLYPKYATAWYELGAAQQKQDNIEGARKSYAQAIAADSKLVTPYNQLAFLAARENKWDEVVAATDKLLHLNPVDFPAGWYYNALANYRLRKLDEAEKSALRGLEADTTHAVPKTAEILAAVLADKHDMAGAAQYLKVYLKIAPEAADAESVRKQLAEVEKSQMPQAANKPPEK